jgi:hypothetical protein
MPAATISAAAPAPQSMSSRPAASHAPGRSALQGVPHNHNPPVQATFTMSVASGRRALAGLKVPHRPANRSQRYGVPRGSQEAGQAQMRAWLLGHRGPRPPPPGHPGATSRR